MKRLIALFMVGIMMLSSISVFAEDNSKDEGTIIQRTLQKCNMKNNLQWSITKE